MRSVTFQLVLKECVLPDYFVFSKLKNLLEQRSEFSEFARFADHAASGCGETREVAVCWLRDCKEKTTLPSLAVLCYNLKRVSNIVGVEKLIAAVGKIAGR